MDFVARLNHPQSCPVSYRTEQLSKRPPTRAPKDCQTSIYVAVRRDLLHIASIKGLQLVLRHRHKILGQVWRVGFNAGRPDDFPEGRRLAAPIPVNFPKESEH